MFEKKRAQHLVADQRPDHVADHDGESAPVGAELVRQHNSRHDAHREGDRKNLGPETHELLIVFIAAAQPDDAECGDVRREPDGEARENNVKDNCESKLQTGKQDRIKIHNELRAVPRARLYSRSINRGEPITFHRCDKSKRQHAPPRLSTASTVASDERVAGALGLINKAAEWGAIWPSGQRARRRLGSPNSRSPRCWSDTSGSRSKVPTSVQNLLPV